MMNNYRTKIKLQAAANQAIYLLIFHRVVGSLHIIINFTTRPTKGF